MDRRRVLKVAAAATAPGAVAGCVQDGTDDPAGEPTDTAETTTQPDGTQTDSHGQSDESWGSGGEMDGVSFSFTSQSPECGDGRDEADITFDPDAGEIVVDGVISGSDLCKRAVLTAVEYDTDADTLGVSIESVDREGCKDGTVAAGQCIADIQYEARFSFEDDLPTEVTVNHDGQAIAAGGYDSASAPTRTTTDTTEA